MQEVFRRAYEHEGSAFVEVLQNCNVFNDGVFATITKKDVREDMLIDLQHGKPILFGSEKQFGVARRPEGVVIVEVAEVGIEYILVHDETIRNPSTAFSLSRLAKTPTTPHPGRGVPRHRQRGVLDLGGSPDPRGPGPVGQGRSGDAAAFPADLGSLSPAVVVRDDR
jgi:hypothetical protein